MIDSIIALHRAEFTGRGTLEELNIMLHKLSRLAEVYNVAVVVINQVQSQPDDFLAGWISSYSQFGKNYKKA
jgi:DNA repair protein RadA